MCPDETLLTAYVDGEVPSPWKERIEEHIRECAHCRERVARYRALGERLRERDDIDAAQLSAAVAHVRARIAMEPRRRTLLERFPALVSLGSKRVSVPLPVLAASLILFVFFAGLGFGLFGFRAHVNQALALSTKLPASGNSNIESLVSTLAQTDPSQFVTIQAPGNMLQSTTNTSPVYVIYNSADQKPTITAIPAQGEVK